MAPTLYMIPFSSPVRAVLITAEALGIVLNIHEVDYLAGELTSPQFLKLNPQHTVPTLDDGGKVIWDSHAINAYLVGKYAQNDSLYPKDLYKRALVDQRLHFDTGVIFDILERLVKQLYYKEITEIPPRKIADIREAYGFLEKFLEGYLWIAGNGVTIADFSCATTVTSLDVMVPLDSETYPNVANWIKRAQALPYFESDKERLELFKEIFRTKMLP